MAIVNACAERDELGGGRFQSILHLRPIAYLEDGSYARAVHDFVQGDAVLPHLVSRAPLMCSVAADGMRRLHPTREPARFAEIGPPHAYTGGNWNKVTFGNITRSGNTLTAHRTQADLRITHAGHYVKLELELLGGYVPPSSQFAFPVGLTGLTRNGSAILRDGVQVMSLRAPQVYDAANAEDVRPIAHDFVQVAGQWYVLLTLPSLAGMSRPVVDPTLVLQPDAAAGKDTRAYSGAPDTSYATTANFFIGTDALGERVMLVAFDVTTIAGVNVVSAAFIPTSAGTTAATNSIYSIAAANNGWLETCTWNYADGAGATDRWAGDVGGNGGADAGCSVSGTDYGAVAIGTFSSPGTTPTAVTVALTASAVQNWVNGSNYGLVMRAPTINHITDWYTSDHATAAYRPKLTVDYTLGGIAAAAYQHYARLRRAS